MPHPYQVAVELLQRIASLGPAPTLKADNARQYAKGITAAVKAANSATDQGRFHLHYQGQWNVYFQINGERFNIINPRHILDAIRSPHQ